MIDWGAFIIVSVASVGSAALLVALFAAGLRLLAVEADHRGVRIAAYGCFVLAAVGAIYGIYLLTPALHLT